MKIESIHSGNINSSYLYFKSNSKINKLAENPANALVYSIPSKFSVNIQENGIKKVVSGECENQKYYVNIYDKDEMYMYGNIGWDPLYLNICKGKGLFHPKTRISGVIGNKKLELECKTRYATQHITGKYGKESIDATIWESIMSDDIYIDGEKIKMTLSNDGWDDNRSVMGKTSLDAKLLPILTGLSLIRDGL